MTIWFIKIVSPSFPSMGGERATAEKTINSKKVENKKIIYFFFIYL